MCAHSMHPNAEKCLYARDALYMANISFQSAKLFPLSLRGSNLNEYVSRNFVPIGDCPTGTWWTRASDADSDKNGKVPGAVMMRDQE